MLTNISRVRRMVVLVLVLTAAVTHPLFAQPEGRIALNTFHAWKKQPGNADLSFGAALKAYRQTLEAEGASKAAAERVIRLIEAHYEAELYNRIYAEAPTFSTRPTELLVQAVDGVPPGKALDVGMGQGRNALYLASKGWDVTGFDVAEVGLQRAREQASAAGLTITTVHAADEEFDFGTSRWDLIAILYALEKRSVHRVRDALKPGGLVVIEAGHAEAAGALGFDSNELLDMFKGFRILRYEDTTGMYEWELTRLRLVRLVAQKPRIE